MTTTDGVTVTGQGSVDVTPDVVVAQLGVEVRDPDVAVALREAESALGRLRDALQARGVEPVDLRSGQTSIWREDRTDEHGEVVAVVVHVTLGLVATLRDVDGDGESVHAALAAAGPAARMDGLSFAVSDAAAAIVRAREVAFDDARATAERYALRAGRALGPVRGVEDTVPTWGAVAPRALAAGSADAVYAAGKVPVEPGQQSVSASVTVHWGWAD
jgi:uncharacterized protein